MTDSYRTIAAPAEGAYKDKGSKFTAYAFPVENELQVKNLVARLKKDFYDARHHCYAYRIGKNGAQFRANDDGEPSGTAGKPILGQLLSADVTNVLVVVVRYFGGTLLGTSGLIAAYKNATADALVNAQIVERTWNAEVTFDFAYEQMNAVMKVVKDERLQIISQNFGDTVCQITLSVRESKIPNLKFQIPNLVIRTI
ncbi:MAG: IMPACT family protein [Prevotellaceae bacterium]|jgi:uncharacterized YigZ family protein|nr:IMPACT family protein [Prevotellaceae bacterium]